MMIELLIAVPSSIKVVMTFSGILLIYRFGVPLGLSIILHALLLGLWTGEGAHALLYELSSLVRPENILLMIVILLLNYFTKSLALTGRIERTINALKTHMTRQRILYAGMPALIGLLPMPGGALFSAPLVASLDQENGLCPSLKVAINYWFRHIWEFWWPIYPGVVTALQYCNLPTGIFILIQFPMTLFALAGGYLFILRHVPQSLVVPQNGNGKLDKKAAAAALMPIGILVLISVIGSYILSSNGMIRTMSNLVSMLTGLIVSLFLIFQGNSAGFLRSLKVFNEKSMFQLLILIIGILLFSAALKIPLANHSATLVNQMRDEFFSLGVPILIVLMVIPFLSGLVTGVAMGFVGASFPLVFALIGQDPSISKLAATTVLTFSFGYMGMMLSPLHMCFVVSNQYFNSKLFPVYTYLISPIGLICAASLILSGVYYLF